MFFINLHYSPLPDDRRYKVELALTLNGRTIV